MAMTPQELYRLEALRALWEARDAVLATTATLSMIRGRLNCLAAVGADTERELAAVERAYSTLSDDVLVGLQAVLG